MELLPKDIVRLILLKHITPVDYLSTLLVSRQFHVLTPKERLKKYHRARRDLARKHITEACLSGMRSSGGSFSGKAREQLLKRFAVCTGCGVLLNQKRQARMKHTAKACVAGQSHFPPAKVCGANRCKICINGFLEIKR